MDIPSLTITNEDLIMPAHLAPIPADHHHDHHPSCYAISHNVDDDDDDQHSAAAAISILWWTNAVCLPTIATIGLICNGLNLLVLAGNQHARRMPSWHLLVALALFDSLFLLFAVLELSIPVSIPSHRHSLVSAHTRLVLHFRMLASGFYKASILIVVAFNVERYLCVCRPLWAHRSGILQRRAGGGRSRQGSVIAMALAIGMLCSLQWPLAWQVLECPGTVNGEAITTGGKEAGSGSSYSIVAIRPSFQAYYRLMDWFCLFAFNLLPIMLLAVLNLQLVFTLRRIVRRDSSASSTLVQNGATDSEQPTEQQEERNANANHQGQINTLGAAGPNANAMLFHQQPNGQQIRSEPILFAVVALLFICIGPQAPARLLYEWHSDHYHLNTLVYTCISQQLVFLNASLNFFLYCLVSRRYRAFLRESLQRLLDRCQFFVWRQRRNPTVLNGIGAKFMTSAGVPENNNNNNTNSRNSITNIQIILNCQQQSEPQHQHHIPLLQMAVGHEGIID